MFVFAFERKWKAVWVHLVLSERLSHGLKVSLYPWLRRMVSNSSNVYKILCECARKITLDFSFSLPFSPFRSTFLYKPPQVLAI